ncbi:haloalkane dehalogenase, partial [Chloroflexota bacterium]
KRIKVLDSEMAYLDTGSGNPIVFLHGNPTSSYLWRDVMPHVNKVGRCLAPDLIGMGESPKIPHCMYRFIDHARYLDAWFAALGLHKKVTLVVHDWGSALGFYWAHRNLESIAGIIYMEAIVQPITWEDWPEGGRTIFQALRSPVGDELVLQKNIFVEKIIQSGVIRRLTEEEMNQYRRPYLLPGEDRRPTLTWPRELPINSEPQDVVSIVRDYAAWLSESQIPKLFINAEPGSILIGRQREFCRTWPNQKEITVKGIHFIQEDSAEEIGKEIATFVVENSK